MYRAPSESRSQRTQRPQAQPLSGNQLQWH